LTYFKQGTPVGDWARECQKAALAVNPADFGAWAAFATAFKKHFVPLKSDMEAASRMHSSHMGQSPSAPQNFDTRHRCTPEACTRFPSRSSLHFQRLGA
jgi:hypothetical protein